MDRFLRHHPGVRSRIAHRWDFPDYGGAEPLSVAETMLADQKHRLYGEAHLVMASYIALRGVFAIGAPDKVSEGAR
jgi:hypothetical protein